MKLSPPTNFLGSAIRLKRFHIDIKTIDESSSSASSSDGPGKGNEVKSVAHENVQLKNLSASIDTLSKIRK